MPVHVRGHFETPEFGAAEIARSFPLTRGYPKMRLPPSARRGEHDAGPRLLLDARIMRFDPTADAGQNAPIGTTVRTIRRRGRAPLEWAAVQRPVTSGEETTPR